MNKGNGSTLIWTLLLGTLSLFILLLSMPRDLNMADEGIILSDATRVLNGEIIHRDFYSNYGPAQYYIVASLFGLFGKHFIVARLYDLAIRAASLTMLFYIVRRSCSLLIALVITAVGGMWLMSIGFYLYPIFPCILLSLISSYFVAIAHREPATSRRIIGAGACAGLAALFRYDVGFLLLAAHFASMAVIIALSKPRKGRVRTALKAAASYGAAAATVFTPAAVVFLIVSPIEPFLADIIDYSTKYYSLMRGLPFPGLHSIRVTPWQGAVYLPIFATTLALSELLQMAFRRTCSVVSPLSNDPVSRYLIVFGSTSALLFLKGMVRVGAVQMLLAIILALVVFALLMELWWRRGGAMQVAAPLLMLLIASPAAILSIHELHASLRAKDRSMAGWLALRVGLIERSVDAQEVCETGPASGIAKLSPDYARVATYLAVHTQPAERILVALDRHDKIFVSPISLYFAAGRLPGTHWHQFDPGLVTRADIQADIISDLQRNHVRWVVRDASFDDVNEPNGSARSSGVKLLDHYLDEHYRPVAASGKVTIWLKNGDNPIALYRAGECDARPIS